MDLPTRESPEVKRSAITFSGFVLLKVDLPKRGNPKGSGKKRQKQLKVDLPKRVEEKELKHKTTRFNRLRCATPGHHRGIVPHGGEGEVRGVDPLDPGQLR